MSEIQDPLQIPALDSMPYWTNELHLRRTCTKIIREILGGFTDYS